MLQRTAAACMGISILYGCASLSDMRTTVNHSGDVVMEKIGQHGRGYVFLVVPDGMQVDGVAYDVVETIGCNDLLVRVADDEVKSVQQAIKRTMVHEDPMNGYYNSVGQSQLMVDHMVTDAYGKTNVYLTGSVQINGVCDPPRIQAQLEHAVRQFDDGSHAQIFVNDVTLEKVLSENSVVF